MTTRRQSTARSLGTDVRIADAAISIVAREGLDALSVRKVADAVGVAIGSVQHHFPTRAELVLGVLNRTVERQTARVVSAPEEPTVLGSLTARLGRLLPSNNRSREEAIVWVAMAATAARDPLVGPRQREVVASSIRAIESTLRIAQQAGEVSHHLDVRETARMIDAVVDGFLLHGAASGRLSRADTNARFAVSIDRLVRTGVATSTKQSAPGTPALRTPRNGRTPK
jgi:AcrR family transcriptional regulator